jgi:phosphate transport system permease protein
MATATIATGPNLGDVRPNFSISRRRRLGNRVLWGVSSVMLALLVAPVVWILVGVVSRAVPNWHWSVFTEPSTGTGGGLSNAIVGTLLITFGVAIIASIVGIGAGVYLSEVATPGLWTTFLRGGAEVLSGIPSIVFGYCGYLALVVGLHWGYSLLPALIVLSMLVVPYIAKATELSLNQVPVAQREGGEALGMSRMYLLRRIVFRAATPGILTGLIVAIAISIGETAPLLYTAGYTNAYPSGALIHAPVGYLTYAAYTFYDQPGKPAQALSADAALLLVVMVLILILCSRLIVRLTQKYSPNRATQSGRRRKREPSKSPAQGGTGA